MNPQKRALWIFLTLCTCVVIFSVWRGDVTGAARAARAPAGELPHANSSRVPDGPVVAKFEAADPISLQSRMKEQEYLDRASNKSIALHVLWRVTGNSVHLNALKDRITLDPEAAILVAAEARRSGQNIADYIDYLRKGAASFPHDLLLNLTLAGAEAALTHNGKPSSDDYGKSFDILQRIAAGGTGGLGIAERQRAMREWLIANGTPEDVAWKQTLEHERWTQHELFVMTSANVGAIARGAKTLSAEARLDILNSLLRIREALNPGGDLFEDLNRSIGTLEMIALQQLTPGMPFEHDEAIKQRRTEVTDAWIWQDYFIHWFLNPYLRTGDAVAVQEFRQRQEQDGAAAAVLWLKEQLPESANPPAQEVQTALTWALTHFTGYSNRVPTEKLAPLRVSLAEYFQTQKPELLTRIQKHISANEFFDDATHAALNAAMLEFKNTNPSYGQ